MLAAFKLPQPPWDYIVIFLVSFASAVSCIILLVEPMLNLRDYLMERGVFSLDGWIGRQVQRRREFKRKELREILEEIGITEPRRTILREAAIRATVAEQLNSTDCPKLISELFVAMQRCMVVEVTGHDFRPTTGKYYVDTMGAVSVLGPSEWSFSYILGNWLNILVIEGKLQPFDAILTPKNGNPSLTHRAAEYCKFGNPVAVFIWKSLDDSSRVALKKPHFLDFEGLSAFQKSASQNSHQLNRKLRVVAVDDNFTSGQTLTSAIHQFNELVMTDEYKQFEPIDAAVALFAIECNEPERHFRRISNDFKVHTLLSVDIARLAKLASEPKTSELMKQVHTFQSGFSCDVSRQLMAEASKT